MDTETCTHCLQTILNLGIDLDYIWTHQDSSSLFCDPNAPATSTMAEPR